LLLQTVLKPIFLTSLELSSMYSDGITLFTSVLLFQFYTSLRIKLYGSSKSILILL